jgi:ATP-dependent DNA ligase
MIMDESYAQRLKLLRIVLTDWDDGDDPTPPVLVVPTRTVTSLGVAHELTALAIQEGYEGGILRTPDDGYRAGFRSRQLLKIKKFDDTEHTIIGVKEGKDRVVNDVDLKVAIFECVTPDGQEFECTAFGDMYEKDKIWHEREKYIGKTLTVKHSGYTKDRKPWHPVALRLREDI